MGISKVSSIHLKEQEIYEVVDRMEDTLLDLSKKGAIELIDITARGLALGMFIEILNVKNPPKEKKDASSN